jgi:hypothetical protein
LFQLEAPGSDDGVAAEAMVKIEPSGMEGTAEAHALVSAPWEHAEVDVETKTNEV